MFSKKCSRSKVSGKDRVYAVDHEHRNCALHFLSKFCFRGLNKVYVPISINLFSFQIFLIKVVDVSGK